MQKARRQRLDSFGLWKTILDAWIAFNTCYIRPGCQCLSDFSRPFYQHTINDVKRAMFKAAFAQVTEELEQASRVSGAGPFTTFRRITVPLIAPMIVSIFVLVFMSSIRDISTPILLATPATTPLSVLMLERSVAGEIEKAAVIGVILSVVAIITAMVMRLLGFRIAAEPV